MEKIPIIITINKKNDIIDDLKKLSFDLDKISISEEKRGSVFKYSFKFIWFNISSSAKYYYNRVIDFIKYRKFEPMFGGGGFLGLENFYGYIFNFATIIIIPGIAFDGIKFIFKKSYKHLKTKKKEYIVIVSSPRQPFDCKVKIYIPNNLSEDCLDNVLNQASELYNNLDNIRSYFDSKEIIAKCIADFQWKIKFK